MATGLGGSLGQCEGHGRDKASSTPPVPGAAPALEKAGIGGLKQDERNKLLRDDGRSLDIEPTSAAGNEDRHGQMCKRTGDGCSWAQWSQLRVPHESTSKSM